MSAFVASRGEFEGMKRKTNSSQDLDRKIKEHQDKLASAGTATGAGLTHTIARPSLGEEESDVDMGFSSLGGPSTSSSFLNRHRLQGAPSRVTTPPARPPPESLLVPPGDLEMTPFEPPEPQGEATQQKKTEGGSAPNKRVKGRGTTAHSKKARQLLEQKQTQFEDQALWKGQTRKRQVDQAVKQLDDASAKLIGDETQKELLEEISRFTAAVGKKFDVLSALKKDPISFIATMEPEQTDALCMMSPPMVAQVLVHVATCLTKDLDQAGGGPTPLT